MTQEEINKTLVEAEGGYWHDWIYTKQKGVTYHTGRCVCGDFHSKEDIKEELNPDFSKWNNFGRLIKIAAKGIEKHHPNMESPLWIKIMLENCYRNIDQIPTLVAEKLAEILKERNERDTSS